MIPLLLVYICRTKQIFYAKNDQIINYADCRGVRITDSQGSECRGNRY